MKPHFWTDFRSIKRVMLFLFCVAVLVLFCIQLPSAAFVPRRRGLPLSWLTSACWLGGWFVILFLRVEDLHVRLPFDFQPFYRFVGGLMVTGALLMAVVLWAMYLAI